LKINKLDEFCSTYNLMELVNDITECQFLEAEYENFGAFLPFFFYKSKNVETQNKNIFFEYSYYAIKALELLVDYLKLGSVMDLSFNKAALYGYIRRNINETDFIIYFNANTDLEKDLQNTYYMIYILKLLNLFDLNTHKIKHFILQNIDYENIMNIYYSYKISELLNLDINFNVDLTIKLVKNVYSNIGYEFYESTDRDIVNQEIFLWICEMARNIKINIKCLYEDYAYLGSVNTITTTFSNLIYEEYGEFTSVRFESDQFGTLHLEKQYNDTYQVNFIVPEDPKYYPFIDGALRIYDHSEIIGEIPIYIETCLEQLVDYKVSENNNNIYFEVNFSRRIGSEFQAVCNSTVRVQVHKNGVFSNSFNFAEKDFSDYSKYTYMYDCQDNIDYYFNITLVDNYFPNGLILFTYEVQSDPYTLPNSKPPPPPFNAIPVNGIILAIIASIITAVASGMVIKYGRKIKLRIRNGEFREDFKKSKNKIRDDKNHRKNRKNEINFSDWD